VVAKDVAGSKAEHTFKVVFTDVCGNKKEADYVYTSAVRWRLAAAAYAGAGAGCKAGSGLCVPKTRLVRACCAPMTHVQGVVPQTKADFIPVTASSSTVTTPKTAIKNSSSAASPASFLAAAAFALLLALLL
jgi:hypothetical protein